MNVEDGKLENVTNQCFREIAFYFTIFNPATGRRVKSGSLKILQLCCSRYPAFGDVCSLANKFSCTMTRVNYRDPRQLISPTDI